MPLVYMGKIRGKENSNCVLVITSRFYFQYSIDGQIITIAPNDYDQLTRSPIDHRQSLCSEGIKIKERGFLDYDEPISRAVSKCISIYLEVDNDIYESKGEQTAGFATAIFAQTQQLAKEIGVNLTLGSLVINDKAQQFSCSSSFGCLEDFRKARKGIDEDYGLLISYEASGGVSYVDVLANDTYKFGFASIDRTYKTVPDYSWSVLVFTHELFHGVGASHTQACIYGPRGNQAIDNCVDSEGGCNHLYNNPKGTIMSYCHLNRGSEMKFHPEVVDDILQAIANNRNLESCEDEEPVELLLNIQLDTWSNEVAYIIKDDDGNVQYTKAFKKADSGKFTSSPITLSKGQYELMLMDRQGDGLFWGDEEGYYDLKYLNGASILRGTFDTDIHVLKFVVEDPTEELCLPIEIGAASPYSSQDNGSIIIKDKTIELTSNAWKKIAFSYVITKNTILEFDFSLSGSSEYVGIGLEENENIVDAVREFQLAGSQTWGYQQYRDNGNTRYRIPIGQYYTATTKYITLVNDNDDNIGDLPTVTFSNIKIYEEGACTKNIKN